MCSGNICFWTLLSSPDELHSRKTMRFYFLFFASVLWKPSNAQRQYTDDEEYLKQLTTGDESGAFNFNADLHMNYSDSLSDIGASVATK